MPIVRLPFPGRLAEKEAEGSYGPQSERASFIRKIPPLREDPFEEGIDAYDSARVEYVQRLWHQQDDLLRGRDRQVEENIRMLCGQHWAIWSEVLSKFIDLTDYLTDDERRWRQFPVMNRLLLWFMITFARMTENPPVISFQPSTGDQVDADLAEVMDTMFKTIWRDAGMLEVISDMTAWLIPGGAAYMKSRIDPDGGELAQWIGRAMLSLVDGDGNPILDAGGNPYQREADGVPFDQEGQPLAELGPQGMIPTGEPHATREGAIVVDALSPLEVRGQWGNNLPWRRKQWHIHRLYYTPQTFYETYGIEHEPEIRGTHADDLREFHRLAFGSGWFGTASNRFESVITDTGTQGSDGYVEVLELWHRPSPLLPEMRETASSPGGRIIAVTRSRCIRDSVRFARFRNTSPIRQFSFVKIAGRPQGTSPQEMLNGPVRTRNRLVRQILEHANLVSNPIRLVDADSGIQEGAITNKPGLTLRGVFRNRQPPIQYVRPPELGRDIYRALDSLTTEFDALGAVAGAMGDPPTTDPSGELVKELRFNSDRYSGPTQRATVIELGRMGEDWKALAPIIYDTERTIRVAGEDNIVRTLSVYPDMFTEGNVDVIPDIESMLPEGRGERQRRAFQLWKEGAWGDPLSPEARRQYLEIAHFPHLSRAYRPGGHDRPQAEQNVGKLLQGAPASQVPIFPWYDMDVFLGVLHRFMKSPQYLKQPVHIQQEMVLYREALREAQFEQMQEELMREAALQASVMPPAAAGGGAGGAGGGEAPARSGGPVQGPPDRGPSHEIPAGLTG